MVLARDASALASRQWLDVDLGGANVVDGSRPNPFGGGSIKSTVKAHASLARPDLLKIDWESSIDRRAVLSTVERMLGKPADAEKLKLIEGMKLEESGSVEVDARDGWARKASLNRIVRIPPSNDNRADDFVEIRVTKRG
jgi:hypothetical protein